MWYPIRPNHEAEDMPDIAGYRCLVTVENKFGQISVTTAFTGYSDFKWYACESAYYTDVKLGKNELHPAWRVLAWQEMPESYNPYAFDVRYFINDMKARGDDEIKASDVIKRLEDGFICDHEWLTIQEHDKHAEKFWEE